MRIYLASGFHHRYVLREMADRFCKLGHEVVSSWIWLDSRPSREDRHWDSFAKEIAELNLRELEKSDTVVVDSQGISTSNNGGVHFELGYAVGAGKRACLVGGRGNTFHWAEQVERFDSWDQLLEEGFT